MKAVLATGNPHKAQELEPLLDGLELERAPDGFDPEETGTTLLQNAFIKARALREMLPDAPWVIADDTGLSVSALGGRPGVYSARYSGPDATYDSNNRLLLTELDGVDDRRAAFVCVLVALSSDGDQRIGCGVLPGRIATEPSGDHGFGYDPVFIIDGVGRTMAEMTPREKNAMSHRGRAARMLNRAMSEAA